MTKFAFVTGANKGIGYEVVRQLAEENYTVFLGARNEELGLKAVESLGKSNVSYVKVDVTDTESIEKAKNKIVEVTDHLDLLINTAGIALDFGISPTELKIDTLREEFNVNFFGTFQMIQTFLPIIKNAQRGKIVNVTTDMASQTMFDNGQAGHLNLLGYNSSKTAANALTLSFGKAFGIDGPEIFSVTPGFTSTDLNGNAPGGKTTSEGAKIIVDYALSENGYNGKILNNSGIIPW
ncbi:SDR family NAD(P)-dependent oxidoreductase [Bacillus sp. JJ1609]|uniref:SDR family NAD(P)-dependent oxidoreductase n=1 Tax=Bacillus sp. JJ1609 TaxID=3122977 RepID=UPI002FFE7436